MGNKYVMVGKFQDGIAFVATNKATYVVNANDVLEKAGYPQPFTREHLTDYVDCRISTLRDLGVFEDLHYPLAVMGFTHYATLRKEEDYTPKERKPRTKAPARSSGERTADI